MTLDEIGIYIMIIFLFIFFIGIVHSSTSFDLATILQMIIPLIITIFAVLIFFPQKK